jgi:hypothetical protein
VSGVASARLELGEAEVVEKPEGAGEPDRDQGAEHGAADDRQRVPGQVAEGHWCH